MESLLKNKLIASVLLMSSIAFAGRPEWNVFVSDLYGKVSYAVQSVHGDTQEILVASFGQTKAQRLVVDCKNWTYVYLGSGEPKNVPSAFALEDKVMQEVCKK